MNLQMGRPSPALVISLLALFVVLGGTGYATTSLGGETAKVGNKACVASAATLCTTLRRAVDAEVTRQIKLLKLHNGAQGSTGPQGVPGGTGSQGPLGPQGPGATTFTATVPGPEAMVTIATLSNGITIAGRCGPGIEEVGVWLSTTSGAPLEVGGTYDTKGTTPTEIDDNKADNHEQYEGATYLDLTVIAADSTIGKFDQITVHEDFGSPCTFWGMSIPSS